MDDFEGVLACRVLADRDATTVVDDGHKTIRGDRDLDLLSVTRHRLVDRVVDDLPDEVMELVGGPDVHAGAPSNGLEALQDLDAGGGVVGRGRCFRSLHACLLVLRAVRIADGVLGHAFPPVRRS